MSSDTGVGSVKRRVIWLVVAAMLGACSGESAGSAPVASEGEGGEAEFPGFGSIGGEEWPEGIPAEIPELQGEIRLVMSGTSHIRLFYEGVSDQAVVDFIAELDSLGYDLEFMVLETPGSDSERLQERAEAGEWDRLRASKGDYMLGLEYGGGTATLDIDGLPEDVIGPDTEWPAAWANIPAPNTLVIDSVIDLGMNGPLVELSYETEADIFAYADELETAGFEVINRSFDQNDGLISITLRSEAHEVTLRTYPGQRVNVSRIDPADSLLQAAPQPGAAPGDQPGFSVVTNEFPEWLPTVMGGEIVTATEDPNGGFTAVVVIGEGHTVAEYVEILNAAGFAESGSMLAGYILGDGERTITIYGADGGMSPLQIMIQVVVDE